MSENLGQRVEQVLQFQQKANRVLTHVLGAQYTRCERFTLHFVQSACHNQQSCNMPLAVIGTCNMMTC